MIVAVFADGGCVSVNPSPIGGTWAWCATNENDERVEEGCGTVLTEIGARGVETGLVLGTRKAQLLRSHVTISNNLMEYLALLNALRSLPDGWRGVIHSDSQITLGRFFAHKHADGWTLSGLKPADFPWKVKGIPETWVADARRHVERLGICTVQLLNGHPTAADFERGLGKRGYPVSRHNVHVDALCSQLARDIAAACIAAEPRREALSA